MKKARAIVPAVTSQKPGASLPLSAVPGLAHPEDAADRGDPGQHHGHPGEPFHDQRELVVHR